MKKNAMLKIAAILMVAVLLTTCAISSTFAKYVTTGKADASARVAKWGVNIDATATGAFTKTYGETLVISDVAVVAPGTAVGDPDDDATNAIKIAITGTPEVATKVNCNNGEANPFITLSGWEVTLPDPSDDTKTVVEEYCPVVFVINKTEYKLADYEDMDEFEETLNGVIADIFGATHQANQPINETLYIDWYWEFPVVAEGADQAAKDAAAAADVRDTALGNQAAKGQAATIAFNFNMTIEQDGPAA